MRLPTTLLFSLLVGGCGGGPLVTDCIPILASNPPSFSCYNEANKKKLNQLASSVDNWVCVSGSDEESLLNACENRLGGVKVNVCIFSAASLNYACFNEVSGVSNGLTFQQSGSYVCVSPVDENLLLDYCASLATK